MGSTGVGWVFLALLVIGTLLLAIVLARLLAGGARGKQSDLRPAERSRAREILDERYARGEIDASEYDERRRHLDGGGRA